MFSDQLTMRVLVIFDGHLKTSVAVLGERVLANLVASLENAETSANRAVRRKVQVCVTDGVLRDTIEIVTRDDTAEEGADSDLSDVRIHVIAFRSVEEVADILDSRGSISHVIRAAFEVTYTVTLPPKYLRI